ncbi:ATP-binding protein [Priestia koreensis]|uniref:ATP-binding protein n=1 Tax=Priestia koreensis TaxID=284581 RepID=UPI001F566326|nr:ATP-binding protein [Priestia koreensis]UNL85233.1 AAA family ATPase [Priestia koreensis]
MRKMIFVGGIHGVGKTTFCNEVSKRYNLPHYVASKLISNLKKQEFSKSKRIDSIGDNQDILVKALDTYTQKEKWTLLDGHFCLLNKLGHIERISSQTFECIQPSAIVIITDEVDKISKRLRGRDSLDLDINFLKSFQSEELTHALEISQKLDVPYFIYKEHKNTEELHKFINNIVNHYRV